MLLGCRWPGAYWLVAVEQHLTCGGGLGVQAAHMSSEAHLEKPPALSLSRAGSGHLVDTAGASFTALMSR